MFSCKTFYRHRRTKYQRLMQFIQNFLLAKAKCNNCNFHIGSKFPSDYYNIDDGIVGDLLHTPNYKGDLYDNKI